MDEQFGKFIEVIQKLYINIPLLDAMQVPTYMKYLRDILNNKRPLPSTEVIKLTEECSAVILNTSPVKKKDQGCPTIDCLIESQNFEKVNAITTRGGKSTRDPPYPTRTGKTPVVVQEEEKRTDEVEEVGPQEQELQQDFHDMTLLPYPCRNRKAKKDE